MMRRFGFEAFGSEWEGGPSGGSPPGPVDPLAVHYGVTPGKIATLWDITRPGGHTLNGARLATLKNFGGTGPYHDMSAGVTSPVVTGNAMQFAPDELMNMANEVSLNGVHLFALIRLSDPGVDELQNIASHAGPSAGVGAAIQYMRNNTSQRFRLQNLSTTQAISAAITPIGAWLIVGMRYAWASGDAIFQMRFNSSAARSLTLTGGGDLHINRLGGSLFKGEIRALAGVVMDTGYDIMNPEPAAQAVYGYLASIAT